MLGAQGALSRLALISHLRTIFIELQKLIDTGIFRFIVKNRENFKKLFLVRKVAGRVKSLLLRGGDRKIPELTGQPATKSKFPEQCCLKISRKCLWKTLSSDL